MAKKLGYLLSEAIEEFKNGIDAGEFGVFCGDFKGCLDRPTVITAISKHLTTVFLSDGEAETMISCLEREEIIEKIILKMKELPETGEGIVTENALYSVFGKKFGHHPGSSRIY